MKRNQGAAILFAVLLFSCGVVSGVLGQRYFAATVVSAKGAEDFRHQYVSEMRSKLGLTHEQATQLEVILDDTKAQYKAVRDRSRPDMLKIKNEQISRVKAILTPQQVPGYERLIAERENRYKNQEEHDRKEELKLQADHRAQAAHQ